MKRVTQADKVIRALRRGKTLTMLDGFKLCGTMNLHKRIAEIENKNTWENIKKREGKSWQYASRLIVERIWVKRNGRKLRAWKLQ